MSNLKQLVFDSVDRLVKIRTDKSAKLVGAVAEEDEDLVNLGLGTLIVGTVIDLDDFVPGLGCRGFVLGLGRWFFIECSRIRRGFLITTFEQIDGTVLGGCRRLPVISISGRIGVIMVELKIRSGFVILEEENWSLLLAENPQTSLWFIHTSQ